MGRFRDHHRWGRGRSPVVGELWREAREGAEATGHPPLSLREVEELYGWLRQAGDPPVPGNLVPTLMAALERAAEEAEIGTPARQAWPLDSPPVPGHLDAAPGSRAAASEEPAPARARVRPGLRALAALLWAEARFLPLAFLAVQGVLLLLAFWMNAVLAGLIGEGLGGPGTAGAGAAAGRGLASGAAGSAGGAGVSGVTAVAGGAGFLFFLARHSADAFTWVAPWLGTFVALASWWPRRRDVWGDLERLSPFPPSTRLLARAAVAAAVATAGIVAAGFFQPPPGAEFMAPTATRGAAVSPWLSPVVPVLLARTAPLWFAIAWALWWALRAGTRGAVVASAALWGVVMALDRSLGPWSPLAVGPAQAAVVQGAMLVAAAGLLVAVGGRLNGTEAAGAAARPAGGSMP